MIGVDTNLIVRLLTQDHEQQFLKAKEVFTNEQIFIADTVVLETEWVLRFAYGFKPDKVRPALTKLLGLPNVHVNNPEKLSRILQLYKAGLDFADAMHLTASLRHDAFLTFDKAFIHRSRDLADCRVKEP